MNLNKQMSTKQTIIFIIVIAIAFFIVQQVVYGQENNMTGAESAFQASMERICILMGGQWIPEFLTEDGKGHCLN